jgi:hypothetical protein
VGAGALLYRDPGRGQETYQLTGDAKQALDYVTRATRTQLNVSVSYRGHDSARQDEPKSPVAQDPIHASE